MHSILCLENEIRMAQVSKEVVVGVFFNTEKAYAMLWKEGILMKLDSMGINLNFLFGRSIQVRVGSIFSVLSCREW